MKRDPYLYVDCIADKHKLNKNTFIPKQYNDMTPIFTQKKNSTITVDVFLYKKK